ncbi:hypothetical protein ACJX0J_027631 [Zea mays]
MSETVAKKFMPYLDPAITTSSHLDNIMIILFNWNSLQRSTFPFIEIEFVMQSWFFLHLFVIWYVEKIYGLHIKLIENHQKYDVGIGLNMECMKYQTITYLVMQIVVMHEY